MIKEKNKGITLIALIITIIVMLILVAVTINVALDTGLFGTAKKGAYQTEVSTIKEQLEIEKATKVAENGGAKPADYELTINNLNIEEKLKTKYGSKLVISEDGILYYDGEIVTDEEEQSWLEEIGINKYDRTLETLREYFLGSDGSGKKLQEISDESGFKDDPETIKDASTKINVFLQTYQLVGNIIDTYIYIKYENKAYKVIIDVEGNTKGVEEVYNPKGNEGNDLGDVTGIEEYDGWTILYDNGDGTVEAVSPTAVGNLTLGVEDETAQTPGDIDGNGTPNEDIDKAIYSYNNAITRINEYCKNLEGLPTNKGVRSVGAAEDKTTELYNGIPEDWVSSSYNNRGKIGDIAYEQDLVRMSYFGRYNVGKECWMASRILYPCYGGLMFNLGIFGVTDESVPNQDINYLSLCELWTAYDWHSTCTDTNSYTAGVCTVIKVQIP